MSFFVSQDPSVSSYVEFGSWDQSAIRENETLKLIRTKDMESWGVKLDSVYLVPETTKSFENNVLLI